MEKISVAILESDIDRQKNFANWLDGVGIKCRTYSDGAAMLLDLRSSNFDLLLLNWDAAGVTGYEILKTSRASLEQEIPIIMIGEGNNQPDVVSALEAGADEFILLPISEREFLARILALLRRLIPDYASQKKKISIGVYDFDTNLRQVRVRGELVPTTPKEFDLALLLFKNIGRVISRDYIISVVWGKEVVASSRTLDTHFSRVRAKLKLREENGIRLISLYSLGYFLELINKNEFK